MRLSYVLVGGVVISHKHINWFFFLDLVLPLIMYTCVCVCVHIYGCRCLKRLEALDLLEAKVTDSCEPSDVGVRN